MKPGRVLLCAAVAALVGSGRVALGRPMAGGATAFQAAAQRGLTIVQSKHRGAFGQVASAGGVGVVDRSYRFGPDSGWAEERRHYRRSALKGRRFVSILRTLRQWAIRSARGSRGDIRMSEWCNDHWGRMMGPAIEGKVASNQFWYIRLRREGDAWRVWRLEFITH